MNVSKVKTYPYFRFSDQVKSKDDLASWFCHFSSMGISCCIVRNNDRDQRYALWREGEEAATDTRVANTEEMAGDIVASYRWGGS